MTTRIDIVIPGDPVAQPRTKTQVLTRRDGSVIRSKNGRVATHNYTPGKRIGPWKDILTLHLRGKAPLTPWDGPVQLYIVVWFARPERLLKSGAPPGEIPILNKNNDWDNMGKAISDVMKNVGILVDDGVVYDAHVRKLYPAIGHGPGVRIIAELEQIDPALLAWIKPKPKKPKPAEDLYER